MSSHSLDELAQAAEETFGAIQMRPEEEAPQGHSTGLGRGLPFDEEAGKLRFCFLLLLQKKERKVVC